MRGLVELGSVNTAAAAAAAIAAGVPEAAADRCVDSFRRAGLLVPTTSHPLPRAEAPVLQDWRLANLALPADYRDPDTQVIDLRQMEGFAAAEAPPAVSVQWPLGLRRTLLPHPVHDAPERPHYALGNVLYYSNAVLRPAALGPLPRTLRVPPSHGAAHPFDLTVIMNSQRDGSSVTLGYDPMAHALVRLPATSIAPVAPGYVLIAVHLAVRRVQWRYRASTAYPTVFLDLGHLLQVMETAAENLSLALAETPVPEQASISGRTPPLGAVVALRSLRTTAEEAVNLAD
ncbi:hypothetical protein [Streptomyces rishiriensis]|uniref:hypothetical protein n=1 Tax=Streptomyces rishiriensis TaxID=68264 RepID=UPI00131EF398|nr:hypothetical protein [Streptomyces rishiriensis]